MAGFCTKCGSPRCRRILGFCPACGAPAAAGNVSFAAWVCSGCRSRGAARCGGATCAGCAAGCSRVPGYAGICGRERGWGSSGGCWVSCCDALSCGAAGEVGRGVEDYFDCGRWWWSVWRGDCWAGVVGYGVWRVAHSVASSVHTDSKGNTTYSGLGGTISAGKDLNLSAADLGVDLYPGCAAQPKGGMKHEDADRVSMVTAVYVTDDPVSSVVAYYKGKLGENESDVDTDNGSVLSSKRSKQVCEWQERDQMIRLRRGPGIRPGRRRSPIVHTPDFYGVAVLL